MATEPADLCQDQGAANDPRTGDTMSIHAHPSTSCSILGGFHKWGYPNSWRVYFMENPAIMDDIGWFRGTPILENRVFLLQSISQPWKTAILSRSPGPWTFPRMYGSNPGLPMFNRHVFLNHPLLGIQSLWSSWILMYFCNCFAGDSPGRRKASPNRFHASLSTSSPTRQNEMIPAVGIRD